MIDSRGIRCYNGYKRIYAGVDAGLLNSKWEPYILLNHKLVPYFITNIKIIHITSYQIKNKQKRRLCFTYRIINNNHQIFYYLTKVGPPSRPSFINVGYYSVRRNYTIHVNGCLSSMPCNLNSYTIAVFYKTKNCTINKMFNFLH